MRSSISLIVLGLAASLASASGGFFDSGCRECSLSGESTINCNCNGDQSSRDLGPHIANRDGQLRWGGGAYTASCGPCTLTGPGSVLGCNCRSIGGSFGWTELELNEHLAYIDGQLVVN
ncbi:Cyanovirin-N [Chaetomium sp. MPI-CAGE-AT-0009]|nr:Cyanovirin-N [Chaetomium sp. MPI-CAGE-AT-0009]